jgi:hypothetical protein
MMRNSPTVISQQYFLQKDQFNFYSKFLGTTWQLIFWNIIVVSFIRQNTTTFFYWSCLVVFRWQIFYVNFSTLIFFGNSSQSSYVLTLLFMSFYFLGKNTNTFYYALFVKYTFYSLTSFFYGTFEKYTYCITRHLF